jgi:glycosyltransferase involved in cell wall biosynthesis
MAREVLHVVGSMKRGGAETWLMHVLRRMDRDRVRFTFCALDERPGSLETEVRALRGRVVVCPLRQGWPRFARQFRDLLRSLRPDVLHSHVMFSTGYLARIARDAGVPVRIAHAHSTQDGRSPSWRRGAYRWLMRRCIRAYCTHGIGCSRQASDFVFSPQWPGWPGFRVIPCGVDTAAFGGNARRDSMRERLGIGPGAVIVGHVGNFRYPKNHAFAVRVGHALLRRGADVQMVFVGDGPLRAETEAAAAQTGHPERFTFAGERSDVAAIMESLFDLLLFPSRYEGLGLVVLEAQCAGIPSLVSDVVPAEATVIPPLVRRESLDAPPDAWADQALEMLKGPRYDRGRALATVRGSRFDIAENVRQLTDLYRA